MSDYTVVAAVSGALRQILWEQFNADPVIRPIVGSDDAIVFRNPTEAARSSANRLSLWLYHVTENGHAKNQPMQRARQPPPPPPPGQSEREVLQFPAMALDFYFLLTPFSQDPTGEADQLLLGKAMQVLYDNAIVLLRNASNTIAEELRIIFCRLTVEELTRIWEALREPYRLSVCYLVRVMRVDSRRVPSHARVVERTAGFSGEESPAEGV